jgi:hypothetical protein
MNRYLTWLLLLGIVFAVNVKQKVKKKFTVSGVVQNSAGKKIKKVKLTIINEEGKKIESGKSKGGGEFKFKKIRAGSYTLMGEHKKEGSGDVKFTLNTTDVDLTLSISNTLSQTNSETEITNQGVILPQQRQKAAKPKLKFEDLFFEYDSNLKALKTEIDSLKRVVKGYQKGQTMPNVSRELLDLIKVPTFQHQVELQNGTVVAGDILEETDSTLILKTQIGTLVLKKEMVVRMDELKKPGPKVILLGDPFIDYYPDRQIFSGKVKNVGEIRADFVRIIGNLFDQTTSITGIDSIFVKGTRIVYESNVVADTALEPGQTAPYTLTIPITKGRKAEYHTMDIHWEETK